MGRSVPIFRAEVARCGLTFGRAVQPAPCTRRPESVTVGFSRAGEAGRKMHVRVGRAVVRDGYGVEGSRSASGTRLRHTGRTSDEGGQTRLQASGLRLVSSRGGRLKRCVTRVCAGLLHLLGTPRTPVRRPVLDGGAAGGRRRRGCTFRHGCLRRVVMPRGPRHRPDMVDGSWSRESCPVGPRSAGSATRLT
jgi:hypothetical protein